MRKINRKIGWLGLLLVAAAFTACASPARQPDEAPAVVAATEPTPAQSPTASTAGSPTMINGYRRTERDGKELYCKRQIEPGSLVRKFETCYEREELERMSAAGKDFVHRIIESSSTLSPTL